MSVDETVLRRKKKKFEEKKPLPRHETKAF
jgi:hypothetical protein